MPVHPYVGRPKLEWVRRNFGYEAVVVRRAKYRSDSDYTTREIFAFVRNRDQAQLSLMLPIFEDDDVAKPWLVVRNDFGQVVSFDKLAQAKLHVEAMFNLEHID